MFCHLNKDELTVSQSKIHRNKNSFSHFLFSDVNTKCLSNFRKFKYFFTIII